MLNSNKAKPLAEELSETMDLLEKNYEDAKLRNPMLESSVEPGEKQNMFWDLLNDDVDFFDAHASISASPDLDEDTLSVILTIRSNNDWDAASFDRLLEQDLSSVHWIIADLTSSEEIRNHIATHSVTMDSEDKTAPVSRKIFYLTPAENETSTQAPASEPQTEQIDSEQIDSEQIDSEQLDSEQLDSEQIDSEQLDSEQIDSEQLDSEQIDSEQPSSYETITVENEIICSSETMENEAQAKSVALTYTNSKYIHFANLNTSFAGTHTYSALVDAMDEHFLDVYVFGTCVEQGDERISQNVNSYTGMGTSLGFAKSLLKDETTGNIGSSYGSMLHNKLFRSSSIQILHSFVNFRPAAYYLLDMTWQIMISINMNQVYFDASPLLLVGPNFRQPTPAIAKGMSSKYYFNTVRDILRNAVAMDDSFYELLARELLVNEIYLLHEADRRNFGQLSEQISAHLSFFAQTFENADYCKLFYEFLEQRFEIANLKYSKAAINKTLLHTKRELRVATRNSEHFEWLYNKTEKERASLEWRLGKTEKERASLEWRLGKTEKERAHFEWLYNKTEKERASLEWRLGKTERERASLEWRLGKTEKERASLEWRLGKTEKERAHFEWLYNKTEKERASLEWRLGKTEVALKKEQQENARLSRELAKTRDQLATANKKLNFSLVKVALFIHRIPGNLKKFFTPKR